MAAKLGQDAVLYYNTASYATPTWTAITKVQDVTLNLEKTVVDVTTRSSGGWRESANGLKDASIEWTMLWDETDTTWVAIRTAFTANSNIELLVLSDDTGTSGAQGLRATCMISGFTRNEELDGALTTNITANPVSNSDAAPAWYTQA